MYIENCQTNHIKSPLGFALGKPVLTWTVAAARGKRQTAARIRIARDIDMQDLLHDTGFSPAIDSLAYEADLQLQPRTRYFWTVEVQSDTGETACSLVNWFETGKMDEPWQATWLTCDSTIQRHPVFSRQLDLDSAVVSARLYICGLGLYEATIDGQPVTAEKLTPYCNNYHRWLQAQTFDITTLLRDGCRLDVQLGNGWYKGRFGFSSRPDGKPYYGDSWQLLAEIRILHADGHETIIGTDASWMVSRSTIYFSNIYDGEHRDDTLPELASVPAAVSEPQLPCPVDRLSLPVRIQSEIKPIALLNTPADEKVFDLGQNFTGTFRLRIHEPRGARVHLQFGEILQGGNFYRDNLRSALAEYIYISDGQVHELSPVFTFYGYRYVKVSGVAELSKDDFTGLVLHSDLPIRGHLNTGNERVNRLIANAEWSMKGNFIDVPTDCPQRDERMGWTGDAQVFTPTACYFSDSYAFYRKFLHDLATEQADLDGKVPDVVPSFGLKSFATAWGDAACIIPWHLYQFNGDMTILREQYASMKGWVDFIAKVDADKGWDSVFHYGDWLALDNPGGGINETRGGTDEGFIAYAYYLHSTRIVAETAGLLGHAEDHAAYSARAAQIRAHIKAEYFSSTDRCCIHTQTALLLTLWLKLADPVRTRQALRSLFERVGGKLKTGFVGTPLLGNILTENGMSDLAYNLLLSREYPGWLYEVDLGATTIWERWNSVLPDGSISSTGMNSLNHYSYGSIVEWIFRHMAGLNPAEGVPGFRRLRLAPLPDVRLGHLTSEYQSAAGTWRLAWQVIDNNHLEVKVSVPFNCSAELHLPLSGEQNPRLLEAGDYQFSYETAVPLRQAFSTHDPVRVLMADPNAKAVLLNVNPAFAQIPVSIWDQSPRQIMAMYSPGADTASLDQLDKALAGEF